MWRIHAPLPGFHIFEIDGDEWANNGLPELAHFDLQFHYLGTELTLEATLSFTLPLELPSGGAGFAVWELDEADATRRNLSAAVFGADNPYDLVAYQTGRMVLHDGLCLHALVHAIVHPGAPPPSGRRITLQGHGVRRAGRWTIYW